MLTPDHAPVDAESVDPCAGVPPIVGSEVFVGGCCPGAAFELPPLADGVLAIKASAAKTRMT